MQTRFIVSVAML